VAGGERGPERFPVPRVLLSGFGIRDSGFGGRRRESNKEEKEETSEDRRRRDEGGEPAILLCALGLTRKVDVQLPGKGNSNSHGA